MLGNGKLADLKVLLEKPELLLSLTLSPNLRAAKACGTSRRMNSIKTITEIITSVVVALTTIQASEQPTLNSRRLRGSFCLKQSNSILF